MTPQPQRTKHGLCISNDGSLANTRGLLLGRAGYTVTMLTEKQVLDSLDWSVFDIVIFCHTVSPERAHEITRLIDTHHHGLPTVYLTSSVSCEIPELSTVVQVTAGPSKLLETVASLVR